MKYYDVLLPIPKSYILTYKSDKTLDKGLRVVVPLGKRNVTGIVYKQSEKSEFDYEIRDIIEILDNKPFFKENDITFLEKLSAYYGYSLGNVFAGIISKKILEISGTDFNQDISTHSKLATLNAEQQKIYEEIIKNNDFNCSLVHGVAGSGKTEIYIEVIKHFIQRNKQVLFIVPEISLTPQLIKRVSDRLGIIVESYHSKLTQKQREKVILGFRDGHIPIIIGARSSLFIPSCDLGLIIIDEEHENSFKQEEAPCYNLRDAAVLKAKIFNIPIILGSATPSLESYYNAKIGKYRYFKLTNKFHGGSDSSLKIIDLKGEDKLSGILSLTLYDAILKRIKNNEQTILFLNRKGYSSQLICQNCGETLFCQNCAVTMTYYKSDETARCHYCGEKLKYLQCKCGSNNFMDFGVGTEKAYLILENLFPGEVIKLDADTITSQKRLNSVLKDFEKNKFKILLGTQLIAKGLNFPNVTLVGILNIDNIFSLPDFRNNERAYQLLTQVAGRAGRFEKNGEVIIQTFNPELPVFGLVNDEKFYEYELNNRQMFSYPPYFKVVRFIFSHIKEHIAKESCKKIEYFTKGLNLDLKILPAVPAPIYKIKNRYRFHLVIKSKNHNDIRKTVKLIKNEVDKLKLSTLNFKIDVDPHFFL
ncbi:MAG: primosomal protein [Deferribacteraceae bacterium]|jgi:primosomal protein N' (replication factor Y)|nr:primosomal protein [Deferribacteraceae bacterium]